MSDAEIGTALTGREEMAPAAPADPVAQLFAMAESLDPDALERMVALAERVQDRQAAMAIQDAHADFQAECPPIRHNEKASIKTNTGGSYSYTYATLDTIATTVRPLLNRHGLSYTWDSEVNDNRVTCTCYLRHVSGGERTATFTAEMDTAAKMSGPQKAAAALTYAKRQSLIQVLGVTTADSDTDAALAHAPEPSTITEKQVERVQEMMEKAGPAATDRVLKWAKVARVEDIPAEKYGDAVVALHRAMDTAEESSDA
jgi:hypothetical protein